MPRISPGATVKLTSASFGPVSPVTVTAAFGEAEVAEAVDVVTVFGVAESRGRFSRGATASTVLPSMRRASSGSDRPCVGRPAPTTRPSRSTVTRSVTAISSGRLWLTISAELPSAAIRRSSWWMCSRSAPDRARVDSSKMIRPEPGVWSRMARAMATSARCAAVSVPTSRPGVSGTPSRSRVRAASSSRQPRLMRPSRVVGNPPMQMFSATVSWSSRPRSWCTTEMPAACTSGHRTGSRTGSPSTSNSAPASGVYRPVTILMRVDLPEPFCPARPCTSPGRTVSSTSVRTRADPKVLVSAR